MKYWKEVAIRMVWDLYEGDCLDVMISIPNETVDLIVTDPPYKVTSRGNSGGTGGILKEEINKKGMVFQHNSIKFTDWLVELYRVAKNGSHTYIMVNNKNLKQMLNDVELAGFHIFKTLVWVKNTSITNMYYMDTHEYIIFARKGVAKKINHCGSKSVLFFDNPRNKKHPTEKPVELMERLITNSSNLNETVLDPFAGSGATGVAAENTGRNSILIEEDPKYCKIIRNRMDNMQQNIFSLKGGSD